MELKTYFEQKEKEFNNFVYDLYEDHGKKLKKTNGGILVYETNEKKPMFYVKTVATKEKLSKEKTLNILRKMINESKEFEGLDYIIISLSGFEKEAYEIEEYKCRLDNWNYIKQLLEGVSIELLSHNQKAYRKIKEMWKEREKVAVTHATGTGKTYLASRCLMDFNDEEKLIIAPSHAILNQFKRLINENISNVKYLTYQKILMMKNNEINNYQPKIIILDEFHRVGAERWGNGIKKILENNKKSYVLGLSATPIRYLDNARDMAEEVFENNIASHLSLEQAIAKKILPSPKYISSMYTLELEIKGLLEKINQSKNKSFDKTKYKDELKNIRKNWEKAKGVPTILKKYCSGNQNKFLIFCENKEHLFEMKDGVGEWFKRAFPKKNIQIYEIYSNKNKQDNEEQLNHFIEEKNRNKIHLLFSINMLNEGLHVNDVSGILLLRKTESPNIYYQQIGRALQTGVLEMPVIFDFVQNFEHVRVKTFKEDVDRYINAENKKREKDRLYWERPSFDIYDEIKDIKKLFEEIESKLVQSWGEMFLLLKEYKDEYKTTMVPHDTLYKGKNLGNWVGAQRCLFKDGTLQTERIEKLNSIEFVWDLYDTLWMENYNDLVQFFKEKGHSNIPEDYMTENKKTGVWVRTQRKSFKEGGLSNDKITLLNRLNFSFDPYVEAWEEMYAILKKCKKENKTIENIKRNTTIQGKRIGAWIELQRYYKRKSYLNNERIKKLEEVGVIWEPHQERWGQMYELLQTYQEEKGNTFVPADYEVDGEKLGNWVTDQRVQYKKGALPKERVEKLNKIKFIWDAKEAVWNEMFELVKKYFKKNKTVIIPQNYEINGKKIGNWVGVQRQFYKKGNLSNEKIKKLEDIGFIWSPHEQKWEEMFELLKEYKEKFKSVQVPYNYKINGKKLGNWISIQKGLERKGELTKERMTRLKKIGIEF